MKAPVRKANRIQGNGKEKNKQENTYNIDNNHAVAGRSRTGVDTSYGQGG